MSADLQQWEARYPLGPRVKVLAVHPAGLIALQKPINVLSHPNSPKDEARSLLKAAYDLDEECYHGLGENDEKLHLCHRLDSATSGVILLAQNEDLADIIRLAFEERRVEKTYFALVVGKPAPRPDLWLDRMPPDGSGPPITMRSRQQFIRQDANKLNISLLRLAPQTGRTHQLRMQCAWHRCPVLGDRTYGDFRVNRTIAKAANIDRLYLHSASLQVEFNHGGKFHKFHVESELPGSFKTIIEPNAALQKVPFQRPTPKLTPPHLARPEFGHKRGMPRGRPGPR